MGPFHASLVSPVKSIKLGVGRGKPEGKKENLCDLACQAKHPGHGTANGRGFHPHSPVLGAVWIRSGSCVDSASRVSSIQER